MAGYIINLNSERSLEMYIRNGAYGTIVPRPDRGYWSTPREMTLADYLTMKPGDLIFFFLKRRIFGVGRLRAFPCGDDQLVALANYPGAVLPSADPPANGEFYLWRENGEENRGFPDGRWPTTAAGLSEDPNADPNVSKHLSCCAAR